MFTLVRMFTLIITRTAWRFVFLLHCEKPEEKGKERARKSQWEEEFKDGR